MDTKYVDLNKYEKLEIIKEINISFCERNTYAKYLRALWLNDLPTIQHFESFGNTPFKIVMNYRTHERNQLFGISEIRYNEYGWLETGILIDKQEIVIYEKSKDSCVNRNYITIAKGLNDKWTFGYYYNSNTSGGTSGACVWGEILETKEEAIERGCIKIINFHNRENWKLSSKVIYLANEKIQEVKGNRPVQLELF